MTNNERARKLDRTFEGYGDYVDAIEFQLNDVEDKTRKETLMEVAETARLYAQFARDNNEYKASDRFEDFAAILSVWVREG